MFLPGIATVGNPATHLAVGLVTGLVAMLMHASLTAGVRIFDPVPIAGAPVVVYNLVLGAALWSVVAAVGVATPAAFRR